MPITGKMGSTKDRPKAALVTRTLGLSDPLIEPKERHLPKYLIPTHIAFSPQHCASMEVR